MITDQYPSDFDSVPFGELWNIPEISGIYFAMQDDEILYVGQSKNIKKRWENHHKRNELREFDGVRIHWTESDGRPLLEQESEWIRFCNPPLNNKTIVYRERKETIFFFDVPLSIWFIFFSAMTFCNVVIFLDAMQIPIPLEMWIAGMIVFSFGFSNVISSYLTIISISRSNNLKEISAAEAATK